MGCFNFMTTTKKQEISSSKPEIPKQEILLRIGGCKLHLIESNEAIELANGDFTILRISDEKFSLATIIKVGDDVQWPLTKDEPVVKLDSLKYLFTLPMKNEESLSYGVSFTDQFGGDFGILDSFLKENSCFSGVGGRSGTNRDVNWKEYAPRIEDYNGVLAKAVARGTGQIVKGIFKCSNAYTNTVQKGGEMIFTTAPEGKNGVKSTPSYSNRGSTVATNKSGINKNLKRVRKMTKMTEKISKKMLDGVGIATGSIMAPVVKSKAGKAFFAMVPGEVLLASLDAVNKILDAAEVAEKQAFSATSSAATRIVSDRFGENAGEATEHVFATTGHCANTAWNIFKIRKAINPASSVSSGLLRNTVSRKS